MGQWLGPGHLGGRELLLYCKALVPCRSVRDDFYHLSVEYPQRESRQTQGSQLQSPTWTPEAHSPREDSQGPRRHTTQPALSGDLTCPYASRTSCCHTPLDLRPVLLYM